MKILLVEDQAGQANIIHKVLLKHNTHEIIICTDAFEAFAVLKAIRDFDVVILDNELPYVHGMELLLKIRSTLELQNLKVIISTADEEFESFRTLGADECLKKPFSKEDLFEILDKFSQ